jgi:hypothetical protein
MHAASRSTVQAVAALQRATALKPQNLSYRKELSRVQGPAAGEPAAFAAPRGANGGIKARGSFAVRNIARFLRRAHLSIYRDALRLLESPRFY